MTRRLILHIGHPKSGTTALQSVLTANFDRLANEGIVYPAASRETWFNQALIQPYLTGRENHAVRRRSGLSGEELKNFSKNYWLKICNIVNDKKYHTVILSAEGLWDDFSSRSPSFIDILYEICDEVNVVAYARSPQARFLSLMNQNVRMFRGISLPNKDYYRRVINAYKGGGFENIEINIYDKNILVDGDIVADFCQKYLPVGLQDLDRSGAERGNESVSNEALAFLDSLLDHYPELSETVMDVLRSRAGRMLREADRKVGGNLRPSLKPEVSRAVVARSEDLPWLKQKWGIEFTDVDYGLVASSEARLLDGLHRVEDFCPIDSDRLHSLGGVVAAEFKDICERSFPRRRPLRARI